MNHHLQCQPVVMLRSWGWPWTYPNDWSTAHIWELSESDQEAYGISLFIEHLGQEPFAGSFSLPNQVPWTMVVLPWTEVSGRKTRHTCVRSDLARPQSARMVEKETDSLEAVECLHFRSLNVTVVKKEIRCKCHVSWLEPKWPAMFPIWASTDMEVTSAGEDIVVLAMHSCNVISLSSCPSGCCQCSSPASAVCDCTVIFAGCYVSGYLL
jgi:hypothetical protein